MCVFVITDQGYLSADICDLNIIQNYSCNTMLYLCENARNNSLLQWMQFRHNQLTSRSKLSGSGGNIYDPNKTD